MQIWGNRAPRPNTCAEAQMRFPLKKMAQAGKRKQASASKHKQAQASKRKQAQATTGPYVLELGNCAIFFKANRIWASAQVLGREARFAQICT